MKRNAPLRIGTGLAIFTGVVLLVGFPQANAQRAGLEGDAAGMGRIEASGEALAAHRRDNLPPFDLMSRAEFDVSLGRLTIILQAELRPGVSSSANYYTARDADVMDLRTLTYHGDKAEGRVMFLHDFDGTSENVLPFVKSIVVVPESPGSSTIHFDPPIRIREGDVISSILGRLDTTVFGRGLYVLHGTVPEDNGGDLLRIE